MSNKCVQISKSDKRTEKIHLHQKCARPRNSPLVSVILPPTAAQVVALEKAKEEKQAIGEIETEHPGYLDSQDTFYVGNIKGVGRIYQQTFIDTYSRVAMVKLYDRKNALTAADILNDKVLPFFETEDVRLLRILTDRGSEYCGNREHHEYQLYLSIEDVDHTKTKVKSPQTNGICERFHKTILNEFYQIAFRKKVYQTLEELQADVDGWMNHYNTERPHSGKYCYGKTPMETFAESKHLAKDKELDNQKWWAFDATSRTDSTIGNNLTVR